MTDDERENTRLMWERLDEFSDYDLRLLVASATTVLTDVSDDPAAQDYTTMPARVARGEISRCLQEAGLRLDETSVSQLMEESGSNRRMSIALLRALSEQPTLAAEVEAAYRARRGMMAIDPLTVSAIALLLLVFKLRRVKVGDLDVTFFEAKESVVKAIRELVGG